MACMHGQILLLRKRAVGVDRWYVYSIHRKHGLVKSWTALLPCMFALDVCVSWCGLQASALYVDHHVYSS